MAQEIISNFGSTKTNFHGDKLAKYVFISNYDKAKQYVKMYFLKIGNPIGVAMWIPSENKYKHTLIMKLNSFIFTDSQILTILIFKNGFFFKREQLQDLVRI